MAKYVFISLFNLIVIAATAQVQTQIIGDSVRLHSNTGTGELIVENSTKNVSGFLYNKGNGRTEFRKVVDYTVQTLTDSSTIIWNVNNGANSSVILKGTGRTLSITNPVAGQTYRIKIIQDSTGSRTITTWPTNTYWPNGIPLTLSSVANRYDFITFYYDGANYTATYFQNLFPVSPNVTIYAIDNKSGTNSTTHTLTGVPAGALLVLSTTFEGAQTNCSVTSSPSLTWTKRADASGSASGDAEIYTAVYTGGGSITITSDWPTVGTNYQASTCYVIVNQESSLGGATATAVTQSTPSVSITTTRANSILICATSDWSAKDGASRAYRDGATESQYFTNGSAATFYHYYKAVSSISSVTEGLTAPTSQQAGTAIVEIRGN